jgi:putative oxidoreductase
MKFIFQTEDSWSVLVLRLGLGVVMFPHGAQKVLGWFGGYGFAATLEAFTGQMHIPVIFAILAILAESVGSLGLRGIT